MSTLYSTASDYINDVVLPALGEYADEHDVDAIAADMTMWHDEIDEAGNISLDKSGLVERDDVDFWDVVDSHSPSHDDYAA